MPIRAGCGSRTRLARPKRGAVAPTGCATKKGRSPLIESRLRPNTRAEDVLLGDKVQLARDLYGGLDGCSDRTATLVHFDHALYGLAILLLSGEMEGLLDPL